MKYFFNGIVCLLILMGTAFPVEIVENFDLKTYNPAKLGLKDLVFKAEIKGLNESLKERLTLPLKNKIYFKVYWINPGKLDILVEGMPTGFAEIRKSLKMVILPKLEYFFPASLSSRIRSYSPHMTKKEGKSFVKYTDETGHKKIGEINLRFSKKGRLENMISKGPGFLQNSQMEWRPFTWSKNKWALKSLEVINSVGSGPQLVESKISTLITYQLVDGFGLPKTLDIVNKVKIKNPITKKEISQKEEESNRINFYDFEINTGKARRHLLKAASK